MNKSQNKYKFRVLLHQILIFLLHQTIIHSGGNYLVFLPPWLSGHPGQLFLPVSGRCRPPSPLVFSQRGGRKFSIKTQNIIHILNILKLDITLKIRSCYSYIKHPQIRSLPGPSFHSVFQYFIMNLNLLFFGPPPWPCLLQSFGPAPPRPAPSGAPSPAPIAPSSVPSGFCLFQISKMKTHIFL